MRISLLLQREPFARILEETLAGFLSAKLGKSYRVRWYNGQPDLKAFVSRGEQPWLCNAFLNAIFQPGAEPAIFDPIVREFARSPIWWKRPAQRAYVALAQGKRSARYLAQAGVGITPALVNAQQWLFVAGNHKLRLLDFDNGVAYGILKQGFPGHFMEHEITARTTAEGLGLPVPPLEAVAEDHTWFCERYVSGTPVNRLADTAIARNAVNSMLGQLERLYQATYQEAFLEAYVAQLVEHIEHLMGANALLNEAQLLQLRQGLDGLVRETRRLQPDLGARIGTVLAHGDFQPANILVNGETQWLIDWEYAAQRQRGYDALVFGSSARFPQGLAKRLGAFVEQGPDALAYGGSLCYGAEYETAAGRRLHATLFLLEELYMHLEENTNPRFTCLGQGLTMLLHEIVAWTD